MLTAIAALILMVLIVIGRDIGALRNQVESVRKAWICPECHGSGHAQGATDIEERCGACSGSGTVIGEMNRWLAQTKGELGRIHNTILELWACPTCFGSGTESALDHFERSRVESYGTLQNLQRHRHEARPDGEVMEIMEAIINAIMELLIENQEMKKLLRGRVANLGKILRDARVDPDARRRMEKLLTPLRTAISDEVAVERLFHDIAERPIDGEPN